jgi:uncharacterized protein
VASDKPEIRATVELDYRTAEAFDPRRLELILLPTERCNFRCTYCYEDFALGRMTREVIDAVKLLLSARMEDVDCLHLSWFGGEPLLAKDIVHEINEFAAGLYAGKSYSSSITTNGYLLDPTEFSRLVNAGTRHFQVSLDGVREDHNAARPTQAGGETFDTIWHNLLQTRDAVGQFEITLRVHISPNSADRIMRLVDMIAEAFGRDLRYRIFLKEVSRFGGPNDEYISLLTPRRARELSASIRERCSGIIPVGMDDEYPDYVCYAAKLNSLLIRSDGRIGKCTVALNDADNIVGILKRDGSIALDRTKLMKWAGGLFTGSREQLNCPLAFTRKQNSSDVS